LILYERLVFTLGKLLEKCLNSGEREWPNPPLFLNTIAEGIKQQQLGFKTFPLLVRLAEKQAIEVVCYYTIIFLRFIDLNVKKTSSLI